MMSATSTLKAILNILDLELFLLLWYRVRSKFYYPTLGTGLR